MTLDVGRQRPSLTVNVPPWLQDRPGCCLVCFADADADAGSDFCTPCRDRLRGDV